MKVKTYKELDVWNKGIEIVDKIYELAASFPDQEKYGLAIQMQRCAVSIPSNVAEGFVRNHSKEYIQFLYVALGSCAELQTQIIIANRQGYISQDNFAQIQDNIDHESRMLMNLIKSLRK